MKRFLLLSLAFIFALNLFAQHISFMGIQLGQPVSNIDRMLVNKGFVFKRMIDDVRKSYDGNFWIYNKVNLSYYVDNGIVTTIYLSPVLGTFDKMSDYNNLVYNLDSKYGKHYPVSNFFKYSTIANNKGYYWNVSGGYIVVTYVNKPNSDEIFYTLEYVDYTNSRILLEKARRRNTNNDL